jgi:hypothetical protein
MVYNERNFLLYIPYLVSTRHLPPAPSEMESAPSCQPSYKMLLEPSTGVAEYVIVEVSLPGVVRIMTCLN